jgi:hypothetical protein
MEKNMLKQCEFTCQGCGKKAPGEYYNLAWHKPLGWYERSDADGAQTACSLACISIVARESGKTGCALPL